MEHVEFEKESGPLLSEPSAEWAWTLDFHTVLNSTFDVLCLSLGIYILFTRSRATYAYAAHAKQPNAPSVPASAIPLATPSLWTRKRLSILLATTLATSLIHLTRLFLIFVLSLDARRMAQTHRAREAPGAMDDMDLPPTNEEDIISSGENPLTKPPALYAVLVLPALMLLSRGLAVVLFAWPANKRNIGASGGGVVSTPVVGTMPLPASPGGPRLRKGSTTKSPTSPTSPTGTSFGTNGHGPTSHAYGSSPHHSTVSPSPLWHFISSLPARVRGPTQNLYLLVFYACVGLAGIFAPFSYHLVWYLDTLRVEFVLSLYLAAVLQDAKNVPGLSAKDKARRGIFTLEKVVYARWAALALLLYGISLEALWRVLLDGSLVFVLWKVDV